jgi:phage gp29-like protein
MAALPDLSNPAQVIADMVGGAPPVTTDPAFQPYRDPLPSGERLRADAGLVFRDIPIVTIATGWTPGLIRSAFADLVAGIFDPVSQLIDSMTGDSRVQAGLASRVGGLLGRPVDFQLPRKYADSAEAKECREAFADAWPTMAAESMLSELQTWAVLLGHGHAQILWDTAGEYAIPHPRIWHPRYTYYDWTFRKLIAVTQDGQVPIEGGDGHWILHAPHGEYRGWMRGGVRAIAPWWLSRNYALRDASRWSEKNGLPLIKAKHPASADRLMVETFRSSLAGLGGETCIDLPQNIPEGAGASGSFDVEYLEAGGVGFEGFFKLVDACDREITLTLLAQTLTSSVGPEGRGSYAAARVHADVRQALVEADARALTATIYRQLARPFAAMNFGNADLAPRVIWNVKPYEDDRTAVETFAAFAQAIVSLKNAGLEYQDAGDIARLAKSFGIDMGRVRIAQAVVDAAANGAPPAGPRARFARMAAENARLRIALGQTSREALEAENEALAALVEDAERTRRRLSRA